MAKLYGAHFLTTLSSLIKDCVDFTGDVDTVAAIAVAAASVCEEYDNDILFDFEYPLKCQSSHEKLFFKCEIGRQYGIFFLQNLDTELKYKFLKK